YLTRFLIGLCPHRRVRGVPATADARARRLLRLSERQAPDRGRALVLDARLAFRAAAPRRGDEPARLAQVLDHLGVAAGITERSPLPLVERGSEQRCLDGAQEPLDLGAGPRERDL